MKVEVGMKVLQINCVYAKGSTGKITEVLHHGFKRHGIESVVYYGRGEKIKEEGVHKCTPEWYAHMNHLVSKITGIMYAGCYLSTKYLISKIEKEQPDIVHLQCINGYFVNIYRLLRYLKGKDIPIVLTLHAEFMYTGGCGYALECEEWKKTPGCGKCPRWKTETEGIFRDRTSAMWSGMFQSIKQMDNLYVVSVSPWLMQRAQQSSIMSNKRHSVIFNGANTDIFHKYSEINNDEKIVFHASPNFNDDPQHIKGGWYVLELAKRMKNVQFIIAGPYNISSEIPSNVKLLGRVSNQEQLAKYYSMADVTVLTSKCETFSMVCAESLLCGTPVVGFLSGAPERIALEDFSEFVKYGDLQALEGAVQKYLDMTKPTDIERMAKDYYSEEKMIKNYMDLYKKIGMDNNL